MNISENLTRIKQGKESIITALQNKGSDIQNDTLINEISTYVEKLEIGGGGDTPVQPDVPELTPKYEGASVFRIVVPEDNYEFAINLCNDATKATYDVDWGDGSLETGLTTDEQRHTYSKPGTYDVNIYNISKDITLGGGDTNSNINFLFNNSNNDSWAYNQNQKTKDLINLYLLIGKNITSIGNNAFRYNSYLISIILSDSVTSIGNSAFGFCRNLKYINISDSVTTISDFAFLNCSVLSSIYLPKNITKLNDDIFSGCESLTEITIPDSVTSIGNNAFKACYSLQSVNIPNSVTSIGNYAFDNCSSLTEITIPEGVTSIGSYTFTGCSSLTEIVIPNSVTSIGSYTFRACYSLQSVNIPNSVTSIGNNTFDSCTSLQSIVIPDSITSIRNSVFNSCTFLQSITCPMTAPTIQNNSFPTSSFKYSKRYLYVPKDSVGYDSGNFKTYLIDKGWELRYIEDRIKIPTTLKLKTKNNFFHKLQAIGQANLINYELINDEYIYNFDDKIIEIVQNTFYNNVLESIELPEGVTSIGNYAFTGCSRLTEIVIPNSVTSIGNYAFNNCTSLQSIVIPNSITSIGNSVFNSCTSLQSIVIPDSVISIENQAFNNNNSLQLITCLNPIAPTINGSSAFSNIGTKVPSGTPKVLRVPEGATGYDSGNWKSYVINKGYTLEYF